MTATSLLATVTFTDAQAGVARPVGQSFLADTSLAYYQQLLAESVVIVGSSSPSSSPLFAGLSARDDVLLAADADADGVGDLIFQTAGVERARIKSNGSGSGWGALNGGSMPAKASTIMAIGDSITANGANNTALSNGASGYYGTFNDQSYLMWACLLSGGKLVFRGSAGTAGYTAAQVQATHLPVAVAAKPGFCVVLAGTNDTGVTSIATYQATMTAIFQSLLAAGIVPIVCTLPPRNDLGGVFTNLTAINVWLARYARQNGFPLADLFGALCQDNGTYASGLNVDNVHPNGAGAKIVGQTIWNAISNYDLPGTFLLESQPATDATAFMANQLFLTDTNADGVPDGWVVDSGAPTTTLATDTANFGARSGKVWAIARGASDAFLHSAPSFTPSVGDKVYVAIKFGTTGVSAGPGTITLRVCDNSQATDIFGLLLWNPQDSGGLSAMTLAAEFTMPAGITSNLLRWSLAVRTAGTLKLAQTTVVDLTTSVGA